MKRLFDHLRPDHLPESARRKDVLHRQREAILQTVLNILLLLYTIGLPMVVIFWPQVIRSGRSVVYFLFYAGFAALTINRQIHYNVRAMFVVLALQALGLAALFSYGLSGTGLLFLITSTVLANLFFNQAVGTTITFGAILLFGVVGFLMITGRISLPPIEVMANSGVPAQWVIAGMVFMFGMSLIMRTISFILNGMSGALRTQETLTRQLELEQASLEARVTERSADLRRRVEQFDVASQIAREISGTPDLESLFRTAVNLIRDRFGFYHVGVFLSDERGEYAVLRAATGEAGNTMLERGHRLKIGEIGLVGFAVSRGEARIAMNVASDTAHFKNPLLPETRSEMALPLRSGDRTIGALDVQSVSPDAFTPDDVRILQTIADQLAIAYEKTNLVGQMSRAIQELESEHNAAAQKAWLSHLRNSRQPAAYRYRTSESEVPPAVAASMFQATRQAEREAYATGRPILKSTSMENAQGQKISILAVPIKLRSQVLGVIDIQFENASVSPELVTLAENAVNRLAVSLENARLLEENQRRAERERLIGEISSKVRAAPDVDSVMRIAVQEIGRSLGVSEVLVQLKKGS